MASHAANVYSDDFNTDTSANYNIFQTTGASSANTGSSAFAWDYSTLGIPSAPNSLGDTSTLGLRVQSDQATTTTSDVIGDISVVTKSLALPSTFKLSVEVWANYIGGTTITDANGSNGFTGPEIGVQVNGNTYESATTNSTEGGALLDAIRDPTASGGTYRVYINGLNQGFSSGHYAIYAAASSDSDTTAQAFTNSYYASLFPSVSAPTAQSSAASTQTGSTPAGTFGFAWHNETVTQDGTNITWAIDGKTIATIPDSSITTLTGSQISLTDQDSTATPSSAANGPLYNFDVYDDLAITTLPEPASLSFLGIAGLAMLRRRRQA